MQDEISDLRLLCQLVEAGNLSNAARRIDSSTPALSRRLGAMESRLGVQLFQRSSRRFTPTQEGATLYERARSILVAVDEAEAEASARDGAVRGTLRVGAPMQLGLHLIAPLISRFSARHPSVDLQFILANAVLNPLDNDLDVAIRIGLPDEPGLVTRRLIASRHAVCATPQYFAEHGTPQTPDDLLRHNCVLLMRERRLFDHWKFRVDGKEHVVHVKGSLASTGGEVVHKWVLDHRGIGIKVLWNVGADLASGRLVECLQTYGGAEVVLYATFRRQAFMPLRMRMFVDFLAAELADWQSA